MDWNGWLQLLGAGAFGALIGWYVYYINRYRKGDVQLSDLTTVIGILGGAVVLQLFPLPKNPSDLPLFGAYGIGLFIGFFGYFLVLIGLVRASPNFTADFFLDGRRRKLDDDFYIPGEIVSPERPPFIARDQAAPPAAAPLDVRLDHGQSAIIVRLQPHPNGDGVVELALTPAPVAAKTGAAAVAAEQAVRENGSAAKSAEGANGG
ncbi:MAG TPA: hypothetical protein VFU81_08950 [Thermomicrobiales bacterium]|nr:hypothetical protein [Thermomicrobiales bacterium]